MGELPKPSDIDLPAAAVHVLEALEREVDKGHYGPRYVTTEDVARAAGRSESTVTKWMSMMSVDHDFLIATWRSGKPGGWKINDRGRRWLVESKGQR